MAKTINNKLKISKKSNSDIYIDLDNVPEYNKTIRKDLNEVCESLENLKKIYAELRDHPKTKGKFKKTINQMVKGANNKLKKTKAIKNNLESSLLKSTGEYSNAMNSSKNIDKLADNLGNQS